MKPSDTFPDISPIIGPFSWHPKRCEAALYLAQGYTHQETADHVEVDKRTITNWLQNMDFAAEVDRLSLMVGVASKAERLRIAMRVIRQKMKGEVIQTDKDVLDWMKFAKDEMTTLSILGLAAQVGESEPKPTAESPIPPSLAGSGQAGSDTGESVN